MRAKLEINFLSRGFLWTVFPLELHLKQIFITESFIGYAAPQSECGIKIY